MIAVCSDCIVHSLQSVGGERSQAARVGGLAALGAAGGAGGQVAQQRTRAGYGSLPRGKEKKEEAGSAGTERGGFRGYREGGFRGRAVVYPQV